MPIPVHPWRNFRPAGTRTSDLAPITVGSSLLPTAFSFGTPTTGGLGLVFSPDSRVLAVSQPTGEMRLVDPVTGLNWATFSHPTGSIGTGLAFSLDQSWLFVQSFGTEISPSVWNLVQLRRELGLRKLDWPADVLQPQTPAKKPESLSISFDDG